jgi:hypothetical protein
MKTKKYEIVLKTYKNGDKQYIPQTQKKNFKYALEWCLNNNCNSCKVNRTYYSFDFDKMQVVIKGVGYWNTNTYEIKEV